MARQETDFSCVMGWHKIFWGVLHVSVRRPLKICECKMLNPLFVHFNPRGFWNNVPKFLASLASCFFRPYNEEVL